MTAHYGNPLRPLALDSQRPGLIVLDLAMPIPGGFETLRTLMPKAETASIPAIMLTVKESDADVVQAWPIGADSYLTTPFEMHDLMAATKRMLNIADTDKTARQSGGGR